MCFKKKKNKFSKEQEFLDDYLQYGSDHLSDVSMQRKQSLHENLFIPINSIQDESKDRSKRTKPYI